MKKQINVFLLLMSGILLLGGAALSAQEAAKIVSPKTTAVAKSATDSITLLRRIEPQINRLAERYKLDEKQIEAAKKLYEETEIKQKELREQLSNLNRERTEKFQSLLTEEQKKIPATLRVDDAKSKLGKIKSAKDFDINEAPKTAPMKIKPVEVEK